MQGFLCSIIYKAVWWFFVIVVFTAWSWVGLFLQLLLACQTRRSNRQSRYKWKEPCAPVGCVCLSFWLCSSMHQLVKSLPLPPASLASKPAVPVIVSLQACIACHGCTFVSSELSIVIFDYITINVHLRHVRAQMCTHCVHAHVPYIYCILCMSLPLLYVGL